MATACSQRVRVVDDCSGKKELKLRIYGYRSLPRERTANFSEQEAQQDVTPGDDALRMTSDIVKHCAGTANLIFANSKGDVEECADLCKVIAEEQGLAAEFLVHHGSLSAVIREDTEATMKSGAVASTFCTSTLATGTSDEDIAIVFNLSERDAANVASAAASADFDARSVVRFWDTRARRKYDMLFDDDLLDICIMRDQLDIVGARAILSGAS